MAEMDYSKQSPFSYAQNLWLASSLVKQLPYYADKVVRPHTYDASQYLYNGEAPTMRTIRNLIRKGLKGTRTRGVFLGDSKTAGSGSSQPQVYGNSVPGRINEIFGTKPGMAYAVSWDSRYSALTGGVVDNGTGQNYLQCTAGSWSITYTSLETFTDFKLFGYISAGGTINVTVDGVAQTAWTVPGGSTWKSNLYSGFADTVHTIVITGTSTTSILGIEPVYATGLTFSNAGRPSSSAGEWVVNSWPSLYNSTTGVGNANITRPDFAIINIGTNTNSSTLADINTFISNVSAIPIPALITVFGGVGTGGNYDAKKTQLYDTADNLNLPLLDYNALIGDNALASSYGLMQDTVHENDKGYLLEANLLARVLSN